MIRRGLIERIYSAASIQRWNDHVRPVELTELDKQSHKLVITYVLGRAEQDEGTDPHWPQLIQGFLYEFFKRVVVTDIKPPVFHYMEEMAGPELNDWVLKELEPDLDLLDDDFVNGFREYLLKPDEKSIERRILKAAHYLASRWEFNIIRHASPNLYGISATEEAIQKEIDAHNRLRGVGLLQQGSALSNFIDLCGQLRFQKRWAQTPRIPSTSVLGHALVVAILGYFFSLNQSFCMQRLYNNLFCGLFHDLPEALTRDIVTPVKKSVAELKNIIEKYEKEQMENTVLPLLPAGWRSELKYFVDDPWTNRYIDDSDTIQVLDTDLPGEVNEDRFRPVDGQMLKICDELAAYVEASISLAHGIRSHHLTDGIRKYSEKYRPGVKANGINFSTVFDYFGQHA